MDEKKYDIQFDDMLYNLRVLGMIENGEYISCDNNKNIVARWSSNWWNTLSSLLKLETFNQTYETLKNIYCVNIPKYFLIIKDGDDSLVELKLKDLLHCLQRASKGIKKLKYIYAISYKSSDPCINKDTSPRCIEASEPSSVIGIYDEKFDTILESYSDIYLKLVSDLLQDKKMNKKNDLKE